MKRGFLLSKEPKPGTPLPKIKIPSGPLPSTEVPSVPPGGDTDPVLITTLPHNTFPGEPKTECLLRPQVKDEILAIPGFPKPFITPYPPKHEIKPVKAAGLGVFATTDIEMGDIIIVERPMIISTQLVTARSNLVCHQPLALQHTLIKRLSDEDREEFFALSNCKGYTKPNISGIADTNAIGIDALPGYNGQCAGVCKVISRINHSCAPNAVYIFNTPSFAVYLYALFPIKKGEQITISYGTGPGETHDSRQKHLLECYGFRCACPSCSSPLVYQNQEPTPNPTPNRKTKSKKKPKTIPQAQSRMTESDAARYAVLRAHSRLDSKDDSDLLTWISDPTQPDDVIVVACNTVIKIFDDEHYYEDPLWPIWYQRLVKAYCALEDEPNARKWAKKAAKLYQMFVGVGEDGGWEAVAKDPKRTDWWGLRKKTGFLMKDLPKV